jgi:hypothetical protein
MSRWRESRGFNVNHGVPVHSGSPFPIGYLYRRQHAPMCHTTSRAGPENTRTFDPLPIVWQCLGGYPKILQMGIHLPVARIGTTPTQPKALVRPALAADAAAHVRRGAAVLEIVSTGGGQRGVQLLRPLLIGFGESPDLIRSDAEVTQHLPEGLIGVYPVEKFCRSSAGSRC